MTTASANGSNTVVAIVPAKDREDSVGATVSTLLGLQGIDRVLVVDDGSADDTTGAARRAGAEVLRLGANRGKGGAVLAGVEATPDADVYLLIDADVGTWASEASSLLTPVLSNRADLVIGVLPPAGRRGGFGNVRRLARWGIRRASGYDPVAPLSGQRAVRADLVRGLTGAGRFGLEVAMTIDAHRRGARVTEVPVAMEHRHTGRSLSGFRHRGAQGADIARALWPRLVSRQVRLGGLAALVLVALVASYVVATAKVPTTVASKRHARKVVVFGIPHVGLGDVTATRMPNLYRLSTSGAYGMITTKTGGDLSSQSVYATLGAGDRVAARPDSMLALDRDEKVEGDPVADVVARRTGHRPAGDVLVPAMPETLRFAGSGLSSAPGALGDALHRAHKRTGVVANSDIVNPDGTVGRGAPAALAVTTKVGGIDVGTVSHDLLRDAPDSPFGVTAAGRRFVDAAERTVAGADVVVLDPGDTDRARAYAANTTTAEAEAARIGALTRTDQLLGAIERKLPPDTLLLVIGMNPAGANPGLTPIVAHGAGVTPGHLESPSTRRSDLVTLTDVAPSILRSVGAPVPAAMIGQPFRYRAGTVDRASLTRQNVLVKARDKGYNSVLQAFVWSQLVLYLIAAVALLRRDTPASVLRLLRWALLTMAAWPIATFLLRAAPSLYELGAGTHVLLWILAGVLALAAGRWRTHSLDPLLGIGALGVAVLCVDVALGAPLQVSSFLGYTPTAAARFVGLGNPGFAVLAAGAVLTCVLVVARSSRPADAWWWAAAVALVVVVIDGAPWLGADVGGILSLVPVLGLALYLLRGRRLNWRVIGLAAAATLVVLGIAVGFEALRAPDQRTHIGRFFLGGGGSHSAFTTIGRKWSTNIRVLTSSTWSWLLPIIGGFVAAIVVFRQAWRRLLPPASAERIGFLALVFAAVLGWAVNDSGPLVAALLFVYLGPYLALLCMRGEPRPAELLAPLPEPALETAP